MFDVNKIRLDFPMLQNKTMQNQPLIYLDNAATTLKPQVVIDAVVDYYKNYSVNINRGDYELSYMLSDKYEEVRNKVAQFINAEAKEIVFTSGASASLNLVAHGFGRKYLNPGDVILSSEAEHASNILPWFKVAEERKAIVDYIPLTKHGQLTVENFKKVMNPKVKVVVLANVTNVLGYLVPIQEITKIAHQYGAIVVVDGAQSVPHILTDVKAWDIDFLAFSAHKMLGPTGVGVLFGKYQLLNEMDTFMIGGGSNARFDMCGNIFLKNPPYKFEAGTPAIEAVLGFGAALDYLNQVGMDNIIKQEQHLNDYLIESFKKLDNVIVYNPNASTGILSFNVKDIFAQDVASYLSNLGIAVRAGNHCAKILIDLLEVDATIRCSLYFYNTEAEIDALVKAVSEVTLEKCIDLML